jgi:hypothetical protein
MIFGSKGNRVCLKLKSGLFWVKCVLPEDFQVKLELIKAD